MRHKFVERGTLGAHATAVAIRTAPRQLIGVVSPSQLLRECLIHCLNTAPELKALDFHTGGHDTHQCLLQGHVDALVVDLACEDAHGLARRIRKQTRIVLVAIGSSDEDEAVFLAEAGFAAFLPQNASLAGLRRALNLARTGQLECSPRVAAALANRLSTISLNDGRDGCNAHLTAREGQILALIDQGLSNKEIAQRLAIQTATVKNHVHNLLDKVGVHRRVEASARWARRALQRPCDQAD